LGRYETAYEYCGTFNHLEIGGFQGILSIHHIFENLGIMSTKTVVRGLVSGAIGATCSTQFSAQALTFDGSSSGQFGAPLTPGSSTFSLSNQDGGTNNQLDWGDPVPDSFSNFVKFNSANFSTTPDAAFNIGKLTYRNGSSFAGSNFNGDFPLLVALNFTNPASVNPTFNYLFNILNTTNTGDPVGDSDRLRFSTAGLSSNSFNVGGVDYTLQLLGFSNDNGTTIINEFLSPENATATANLYGKITTTNVPTPALLPGLIGLGATAWRKRRNAATAAA
jgi:hypothetical protein